MTSLRGEHGHRSNCFRDGEVSNGSVGVDNPSVCFNPCLCFVAITKKLNIGETYGISS